MHQVADSHSSMTNRFSWANTYLKSSFGDFRGSNGGAAGDARSSDKPQSTRRCPQTTDQQRQITYRSSDHAWNEHLSNPNAPSSQTFRTDHLSKSKLSTSTRHLNNTTPLDHTATSMPHLSTSSVSHTQRYRDDINNGDSHVSSRPKSRQITRNPRTSINLEKTTSGSNGFNLPARTASYHSARLDASVYPRQGTSKQRSHNASKSSLQDASGVDLFLNGSPDENSYYFHQQSGGIGSMQRMNGSTFDISASRRPFPTNKSHSFNTPTGGQYNSARELHRSDSNVDRTNTTRLALRGTTTARDSQVTTPKQRRTPSLQASGVSMLANMPEERERSGQSYVSRDPNVSYAYNNVKKYIEENDLMTPEKEHGIRSWVAEVEKYRHEFQKLE